MSSALEDLPPAEYLMFACEDLDCLLDLKILLPCVLRIWKQRGQAFCKHAFASWTSAMLSLLSEEVSLLLAMEQADDLLLAEDPHAFERGEMMRAWMTWRIFFTEHSLE